MARASRSLLSLAAAVRFLGAAATAGKLGPKMAAMTQKLGSKADELAACLKGPNCFVAGTQVVVAVSLPSGLLVKSDHEIGVLPNGLSGSFTSPESSGTDSSLDAVFAAGAFVLMAGLSYQQRRASRRQQQSRGLVPVGS